MANQTRNLLNMQTSHFNRRDPCARNRVVRVGRRRDGSPLPPYSGRRSRYPFWLGASVLTPVSGGGDFPAHGNLAVGGGRAIILSPVRIFYCKNTCGNV